MEVRVFGPVEVSVDGRPVALGGGKPRALLAMLALNAGSTVSTERLIEGLWGERAAGDRDEAGAALRVPAAQGAGRRRGRRGDRHARARLRAARSGPIAVDARRFERLVARGAPREALALWRGPPLDDVGGRAVRRPPRSAGWRSCGWRRSSSRSSATWPRAAIARSSASSRRSWPRSRCASGCTRSECWRCIAPAGRPTRSRPTAGARGAGRRDRRGARAGAAASCTRRSCARTPALEPPARRRR